MALFSLYYSLCIAEGVKTRWNVFIQSKGRWPTQAISQKKGGVNQRIFFVAEKSNPKPFFVCVCVEFPLIQALIKKKKEEEPVKMPPYVNPVVPYCPVFLLFSFSFFSQSISTFIFAYVFLLWVLYHSFMLSTSSHFSCLITGNSLPFFFLPGRLHLPCFHFRYCVLTMGSPLPPNKKRVPDKQDTIYT